ncbi:hypothetical protein MHY87_14830 [Microvirga sp. ACRRW]|uniref:hypothetical protein n=1 Tax=Microvirga sp. ACRRW TaxID=2918205 RepID=UPI001EF534AF|nr:hypothetical protein [Microvirga sp. ACRRW]MCG7394180.1 hypothetical protein [Microvirga sp. ACRRW]
MVSEQPDHVWRRFAVWSTGLTIGLFALVVAALYLIDPYDTGRSPLAREPWLKGQRPGDATASVGRNPKFTGAIIGNSTIALIRPARLIEQTGIPFAQLSMPAAPVRGQLTMLDWFVRHHPGKTDAIVMTIDRGTWCTRDPKLPTEKPFPFWLYSRSTLEYLQGLVRLSSLEQVARSFQTSRSTKVTGEDGFWDYEPMYEPLMRNPVRKKEVLFAKANDQHGNTVEPFPGADALEAQLKSLPAETVLVLAMPPVFSAMQPAPKTPRHASYQACRKRFYDLAARRPGAMLVDWWDDRPEFKNADLFIDQVHIRRALADRFEDAIIATLQRVKTSQSNVTPSLGNRSASAN